MVLTRSTPQLITFPAMSNTMTCIINILSVRHPDGAFGQMIQKIFGGFVVNDMSLVKLRLCDSVGGIRIGCCMVLSICRGINT